MTFKDRLICETLYNAPSLRGRYTDRKRDLKKAVLCLEVNRK